VSAHARWRRWRLAAQRRRFSLLFATALLCLRRQKRVFAVLCSLPVISISSDWGGKITPSAF